MIACAVLVVLAAVSITSAIQRPRGVSFEKASFYEGGEFRCFSDAHVIPMDHVNDDYCDCSDGSDEPGTAACNNGLFYCENKPYKGIYINSNRVNDGICDCCDGSDEYDGTITCGNTCEKMFAEIRAQQEAFREKQEKGYKVKLEYIQQGKRTKDEKVARLSELEKAKEVLIEEKDRLEVIKEEVEIPEKDAKDKHEAAWEAVKQQQKKAEDNVAASEAFNVLDVNQDGKVDITEIQNHSEFDIDSDGTVSDEEAKEYLEDGETSDLALFTEIIWPNIKEIYKKTQSETVETEESRAEPEKVPDVGQSPDDPPLNKNVSEEEKMPDYNEDTKQLISVADEAREIYDEADKKVRDTENEINGIKKYLELDLGPSEEFSALKEHCFEFTEREYTYTFCPFDKTSQKPKGGGIETSLGIWGHWYGPEEDKYDAMKFENGLACWNGPARSCHVNLHCGAENELTGASEPSRCEYQFEFSTPARCKQPTTATGYTSHEEL